MAALSARLLSTKQSSIARPAPITVYRALDFLMENGLVHRIESRNAFLACAHNHDASSSVAFLICDRCHSATELEDAQIVEDGVAQAVQHHLATDQADPVGPGPPRFQPGRRVPDPPLDVLDADSGEGRRLQKNRPA